MAKGKTEKNSDYQKIIECLGRVASGDFATEMHLSTENPNNKAIAQAFNNMIHKLKNIVDELRDENRQILLTTKRLKKIFDNSRDIILYINKYGTIVDINKSVKEILGYDSDELKGKHFAKAGVISEHEIPKLIDRFNLAITKGIGKDLMKLEFKKRDGEKLWLDASVRLLKSEDEIEGAVIVLRDTTKQVLADVKLYEEQEKMRAILSSIEDAVLILDKDYRIIEYYKSLIHDGFFIASDLDRYIGKSIKFIIPRSTCGEIEAVIEQCMKTGQVQQVDCSWIVHKQAYSFNVRVAPIRNKDSNIVGTAVVIRDITLRVDMEKAIAQSEKKYREIFEQSPQGLIILDAEGKIIDVNKKICEWLGYKPEDMIGKDHILYPFLTKSGKIVAIKKFIQRLTGKFIPPYELEFIAKDGQSYIGEIDARPIKDEKGNITLIVVMVTDVTRRH